jgi:GT2 family glycosyltransferase
MDTPVALILFNRPETTARVFAAIRAAQPSRLLLIADGPRPDRPGEAERCRAARAVVEAIDWPCQVERNFSDINLGCGRRVSSGLDWVFGQVPEAIILEDDCLPDPSFFAYCDEMLARYREDQRVMLVTGTSFRTVPMRPNDSYHFSRYPLVWGWASWRRAWQHYDFRLKCWPELKAGHWLDDLLDDPGAARFWGRLFDRVAAGEIDTWDFQLVCSLWAQGGLTIIPRNNLVRNIGFGPDATHTGGAEAGEGLRPVEPLKLPLHHPAFVLRDARIDRALERTEYSGTRGQRIRRQISRLVRKRR